jgi:ribosomal protein S18 acetylase RimI-like enzyme
MDIRQATKQDCLSIAELALIAGDGIPAFFWRQAKNPGQALADVGAQKAASETENFSYRNVQLATVDDTIAGMLLAYRLPEPGNAEELTGFPEFIWPLIELERCVPGSFYLNMLATYPEFRNRGVGTRLLAYANRMAADTGCATISVEVFEQNTGALRLYQRLGYSIVEKRRVISHPSHPYTGEIALLTKAVDESAWS